MPCSARKASKKAAPRKDAIRNAVEKTVLKGEVARLRTQVRRKRYNDELRASVAQTIEMAVTDEMLTIAQGTAEYNAQAFNSLSAFWAQMENYVWFRWWHWGPLLVLAVSYWLLALSGQQPAASDQLLRVG